MSLKQKLALVCASIFYVLTIYGIFHFSTTLLVIMFMAHSTSLIFFSYLCYQAHNDYTSEENLQQEIGALTAEKQAMEIREEMARQSEAKEKDKLTARLKEVEKELADAKYALTEANARLDGLAEPGEEGYEGLLPEEDAESEIVDIIDIAKEAIRELSVDARANNLVIRISSASDRLQIRAGRKRMLIMFRNIIDNSIKYMKRAGSLVITISGIEDDIFIVLKDNGRGLDEEETRHVFELNYQGSNRLSGNGLGLAQARAIAVHYGGTIYARSTSDGGFAVYIQIPARVEAQE